MTRKAALLILGLVLLAGASLCAYRLWRYSSLPKINRDGVVILTYEIDERASPPGSYKVDDLLARIRRRLGPADVAGIEVRSGDAGRIEIAIPQPRPEQLESIKAALAVQGRLEFLIVANAMDDEPALDSARDHFKRAKDDLARREKANERPPPPQTADGKTTFPVALKDEPDHSCRWVELGKSQLLALGLNKAALEEEENADLRARVEAALAGGEPFVLRDGLFYCVRAITDWTHRDIRDRESGKIYEFFVLLREPGEGKEITGDSLESVTAATSALGRPALDFRFSTAGGNLFYELTSKNSPTGDKETGFQRQLAILFNGQVVSSPTVNEPIRSQAQITGHFTQQEIDDCVGAFRAGALPARLRPDPVSQITMEPGR